MTEYFLINSCIRELDITGVKGRRKARTARPKEGEMHAVSRINRSIVGDGR